MFLMKNRPKSHRAVFKKREFNGNHFTSETEKDTSSTREEQARETKMRPNTDEEANCSTPNRQKTAM